MANQKRSWLLSIGVGVGILAIVTICALTGRSALINSKKAQLLFCSFWTLSWNILTWKITSTPTTNWPPSWTNNKLLETCTITSSSLAWGQYTPLAIWCSWFLSFSNEFFKRSNFITLQILHPAFCRWRHPVEFWHVPRVRALTPFSTIFSFLDRFFSTFDLFVARK